MPTIDFGVTDNPYEDWGPPPALPAYQAPAQQPATRTQNSWWSPNRPQSAPTQTLPEYQRQQIGNLYQQYLGRPIGESEYAHYYGVPNYEDIIRQSPEAKAYASRGQAATGGAPGTFSRSWFQQQVAGKPFAQQTLLDLESALQGVGSKLTPANQAGERTKVWDPTSQQWVRVGFGEGDWTWVPQGASAGTSSQFSDPATQQLEAYLNAQMGRLEDQRTAQERANVGLRQRQLEAQASADRLTKFLQERAGRLQGPAYTGTEQEILRTQQLDPLERDRQAAKQRALHNISARGIEPESGIAQELLNQVDRAFDEQRAQAQGQLGYRQVMEQRSREQEAQALLAQIPQLQRAGMAGDLDFLQALDAAVNRPAEAQMPLSMMQYQLPQQALRQALAVMGMAPSEGDLFNQAMGLYGMQQQQRNQRGAWTEQLMRSLPWLLYGSGQ